MCRILSMARDYSTRRKAFGDYLKNYPLHVQTLALMEVEVRAATILVLEVARLLGREDTGIASDLFC
uniref:Acyl-CoA dehydrogenase/oxidase C-terminal domain-containing protein n=1 Tax=Magallana gigas TaxID=29159 RepID=K1PSY4_MAGGI